MLNLGLAAPLEGLGVTVLSKASLSKRPGNRSTFFFVGFDSNASD
jgi:hypothetical protein